MLTFSYYVMKANDILCVDDVISMSLIFLLVERQFIFWIYFLLVVQFQNLFIVLALKFIKLVSC